MRKVCVPARIEIDTTEKITPLEIKDPIFDDWFELKNPKCDGMKYNMTAGIKGIRYTCGIDYYGVEKEIHLFKVGALWFVLSGDY